LLTDFVAQVRNLVGDVGSCFFTAGRCDQQTDSDADSHANQQSAYFADYSGFFFPAKDIRGTAQAVGRSFIRLPGSVFDVAHVVRRTITQLIEQKKARTKKEVKQLFSFSGSHFVLSRAPAFGVKMKMRKWARMLAGISRQQFS
jgi:hypothetical protein